MRDHFPHMAHLALTIARERIACSTVAIGEMCLGCRQFWARPTLEEALCKRAGDQPRVTRPTFRVDVNVCSAA